MPTRSERVRQASRERRAQQKEELRQAILTAAAGLFQQKGYEAFSLREVAETIGYSATTIYLYFKDKDDLLSALMKERYGDFSEALEHAVTAYPDPVERLVALGNALLDFALKDPAFFRGSFLQRPDILFRMLGKDQLYVGDALTSQAVQAAMEQGRIAPGDPCVIADALGAIIFGVAAVLTTRPIYTPERLQALRDTVMQITLKGLLKP